MKLLLDENLSPKITLLVTEVFPESLHVRDVGLASATDEAVWNYAKERDYTIATKDSDFHQRSLVLGFPPKVVWFRQGYRSTAAIVRIPSRVARTNWAFSQ